MDDVILSCLDPPDVVLSCLDPPDVDVAVDEEAERASLDRRHVQKVKKKTKKKATAPPRELEVARPSLDDPTEGLLLRLRQLQAPECFIRILYLILRLCPVRLHVTHAEYFAGQKEVTKAHRRAGHVAGSFELLDGDHEDQNILSNIGFVNATRLAFSVVHGGASTSAPVCSSWVFMNSAIARRSISWPMGDTTVDSVYGANVMVARVLLLHWVFVARYIFFVIEQPCSSSMERHHQFQAFLRSFPLWRQSVAMGDFGALSQKASWLYSGHSCIGQINLYHSTMRAETKTKLAHLRIDSLGKRRVDGSEHLKGSQAYTAQFGWGLLQVYRQNLKHIKSVSDSAYQRCLDDLRHSGPISISSEAGCSWWRAARLDMVEKYLEKCL